MNKQLYYLWVGKELKRYRKLNKFTLKEVSDRIGVTLKQVQNYEKGVSKISFPTIIELCELYRIDVEAFTLESLKQLDIDIYKETKELK